MAKKLRDKGSVDEEGAGAIEEQIKGLVRELGRYQQAEVEREIESKLEEDFETFRDESTTFGEDLNEFYKDERERDFGRFGDGVAAELVFTGFLEGDLSEKTAIGTHVSFSGGWLLRTFKTIGINLLFDPGNGTITGLRESGLNLRNEVDVIICSHAHPQAVSELHTVLNVIRGRTPGRSAGRTEKWPEVHLFATECVVNGRNDHPSQLGSTDLECLRVPNGLRIGALGDAERIWIPAGDDSKRYLWREKKGDGDGVVQVRNSAPEGVSHLVVEALPARHTEAVARGKKRDQEGMDGKAVFAYLITGVLVGSEQDRRSFSVLYTGDTEFDENVMTWVNEGRWEKEAPDILVANTKTIEYLPRKKIRTAGHVFPVYPTANQLGFLGTRLLAEKVGLRKGGALVMRAFGLETVVRRSESGAIVYAPERLAVYQKAMAVALEQGRVKAQVVIPGRTTLHVQSGKGRAGNKVVVTEEGTQPFLPYDTFHFGDRPIGLSDSTPALHVCYVTGNRSHAATVMSHILRLAQVGEKQRFLVIEGAIGSGKTWLAEAIAREVARKCYPGKRREQFLKLIPSYDLAAVPEHLHLSLLTGTVAGIHNDAKDRVGLLGVEGVLIMNQLDACEDNPEHVRILKDIVENWQYRVIGETLQTNVVPAIIFTTNRPLAECEKMPPDLVNRLRGKRIEVPSWQDMSPGDREHHLRLMVNHWCQSHRSSLGPGGMRRMLQTNWSVGLMRSLRNVLSSARERALMVFPTNRAPADLYVHISEENLEEAIHVVMGRQPERGGGTIPILLENNVLDERSVWLLLLLLIHGGVKGEVRKLLASHAQGRTASGISARTFDKWIQEGLRPLQSSWNWRSDASLEADFARWLLPEPADDNQGMVAYVGQILGQVSKVSSGGVKGADQRWTTPDKLEGALLLKGEASLLDGWWDELQKCISGSKSGDLSMRNTWQKLLRELKNSVPKHLRDPVAAGEQQ